MNKPKKKDIIKWCLKFLLSGIALYFVFRMVDPTSIFQAFFSAHQGYLLLALLAFNGSKIVAAFRLNRFYKVIGVYLTNRYNLVLYYIGMFYNLFLPGSVGGDAYKVFLLQDQERGRTKPLILSTLLDRVSGLTMLALLTFGLILLREDLPEIPYLKPLALSGLLLILPTYWLLKRIAFKQFMPVFWPTIFLSFWVQIGQLICAYFILMALGIQGGYLDYLILFMVSSVVAVLPFTIGGVGARELVFLYGYHFLVIEESLAVAFTFLFFSTLVVSSLPGLAFSFSSFPAPEGAPLSQIKKS
ncbi:lysylphosphatidylglycerol synthase transmembrane domain-containing protein [uncultured Cyclobacterium sp.]|uniref:lysylphosphatidylglycerol synthase transmembrane domain-containing protein n=1 Tax=uncultured Cyclobacterium sp. TaxID=453820 RepID=UPI0030EC9E0B